MISIHQKLQRELANMESRIISEYSINKDFLLITKPELISTFDDFKRAYKVAAIEGFRTNRYEALNKVITTVYNNNLVGAVIPTNIKNLDESCELYFQDNQLIHEIILGKTIADRWGTIMNKISPEIKKVENSYAFTDKYEYNKLRKKAEKMTDCELLVNLKESMNDVENVNFRLPMRTKNDLKYNVMSELLFARGYSDLRGFFPL